eukprot:SAG11_NODE_10532_length_824_cov_1.120000_1_plen_53_part_00
MAWPYEGGNPKSSPVDWALGADSVLVRVEAVAGAVVGAAKALAVDVEMPDVR